MGLDMYLSKRIYIGNNWRKEREQEKAMVKVVVPSMKVQKDAKVFSPVDPKSIRQERITEITEQVAYWRKANQIHRWFVENVQDDVDNGGDYYVTREQLQSLLDTCKKVKAASKLVDGRIANGYSFGDKGEKKYNWIDGKVIEDPSVARELLPTQEGFFFGDTHYDEYYMADIDETIQQLEEELADGNDSGSYYYHASW